MNLPVNDGRLCPIDYHYSPADIAKTPHIAADTLYVIGGLYGNLQALETIEAMAAAEAGPVTLVFNGDFNWFNRDAKTFAAINERVLQHHAMRGNVETEIARAQFTGGCGCGYPASVADQTVEWSNEIIATLRDTANQLPQLQIQLRQLPRFLRFQVGDASASIVHGDCRSLAGWSLAREDLQHSMPANLRADLTACDSDIIASTHTCEPIATTVKLQTRSVAIINNGAAGMPNLRNKPYGIITRIGRQQAANSLSAHSIAGVYVEALAVAYDHQRFREQFVSQWPPTSAAHNSYYKRICSGTDLELEDICRGGFLQRQ